MGRHPVLVFVSTILFYWLWTSDPVISLPRWTYHCASEIGIKFIPDNYRAILG